LQYMVKIMQEGAISATGYNDWVTNYLQTFPEFDVNINQPENTEEAPQVSLTLDPSSTVFYIEGYYTPTWRTINISCSDTTASVRYRVDNSAWTEIFYPYSVSLYFELPITDSHYLEVQAYKGSTILANVAGDYVAEEEIGQWAPF